MDLLFQNCELLYVRDGDERHGADLRISGNRVAEIGGELDVRGARVVDCRGKVVLPGLINSHHHFFQVLTRCLPGAQNAGLFDWLVYHYQVWRHVRAETFDAAARLAIAELLLTGCTTSADHCYLFPAAVTDDVFDIEAAAARELGIRFAMTRGSMTLGQSHGGLPPDDLCERDDDVLKHSAALIARHHDPAECAMCQVHLAPCSPFNVSRRLLQETAVLARRHGVRLHTHLAETRDETEYCLTHYSRRPLQLMEELEWLGPDVWFAHGIHFADEELELLARAGTGIAHCPASNMRLGSGVARVPDLLRRGVPVGLAVDGGASNDSSDMLGELRLALLANRAAYGSDALTARQVVHMATAGSARVLGRAELGMLEVGQAADIAIFDLNSLAYAGAADPLAALLLCGYSHAAWMVVVNGEVVVEAGQLMRADVERIRLDAAREARSLWRRAGIE